MNIQPNGKVIIIGVAGLILVGLGIADIVSVNPDLISTDSYSIVQGEDHTISFYFYIGVPLLIFAIVRLIRDNKKIK